MFRVALLAKKSVGYSRGSSAYWMGESICMWSFGVRRRDPMTTCKESFRTLSMRRVCALRQQTGAQY